jgi:hypothetical protein
MAAKTTVAVRAFELVDYQLKIAVFWVVALIRCPYLKSDKTLAKYVRKAWTCYDSSDRN